MENKTLYIPINPSSLPHYFSRAIILPARYYDNKPTDIQDSLNSFILLANKKWTGHNECSIEVSITPFELENLRQTADRSIFWVYNNAFPISRIVAIYFKDKKQGEITQWNINSGSAFLPNRLIKTETQNNDVPTVDFSSILPMPDFPIIDLTDKAKRFDILLGGVAFLKAASKQPGAFPINYFSVLSVFNQYIKAEYMHAVKTGKAEFDDSLSLIFTSKKSQLSPVQSLFYEEVTVGTVEKAAKDAKVILPRKYGLFDLEKLSPGSELYQLVLLATYGNNKPKSLQDLISTVLSSDEIVEEQAEKTALIFGLNVRYSGLRNAYSGKNLPIKFKLETLLDVYTIESVFHYTFNNSKENRQFSYLDEFFKPSIARNDTDKDVFWILDTPVPVKKKMGLDEEYLEQLAKCFPDLLRQFEKAALESVQRFKRELSFRDKQIVELKSLLKTQTQPAINNASIPANEPIDHNDGLQKMEFKDLKSLAKRYKIPAKIVNASKNSLDGMTELITLIRNNKPLL